MTLGDALSTIIDATSAGLGSGAVRPALAELTELTPVALKRLWHEVVGAPPPPYFRRDIMIRALAYRIQAQKHGDLSARLQREMRTLALGEQPTGRSKRSAAIAYAPGARLLRTWRGVLHEVTVRAEGYEWRGDMYSSLSRVAFEITGTKWNGLRFFGVRAQSSSASQA